MYRGLILGGIAFAAVVAAERQLQSVGKDIERYNRIREMSGDPGLLMQGVGMLKDMVGNFGDSRRGEALGVVEALQSDLVRYARISTM